MHKKKSYSHLLRITLFFMSCYGKWDYIDDFFNISTYRHITDKIKAPIHRGLLLYPATAARMVGRFASAFISIQLRLLTPCV
ncbi:hypothetical protein CON67_14460 [Bacillus toyonensis]|nr:hypothetical protein CON67_14460 [Bacillus toyonensis]